MESWKTTLSNSSYEVSNIGNVRSLPRYRKNKHGSVFHPGSALKGWKMQGYIYVRLSENSKKHRDVGVHQLVLEAFVGLCPEGEQTCHRNGIRDDNRLENLYWGTPKQNQADREMHGRTPRGSKSGASSTDEETVMKIKNDLTREIGIGRLTRIAKKYGVNVSVVWYIDKGKTWRHVK